MKQQVLQETYKLNLTKLGVRIKVIVSHVLENHGVCVLGAMDNAEVVDKGIRTIFGTQDMKLVKII